MRPPYNNDYRISQHYSTQHTGVDLVGIDKNIYAVMPGIVDYCGWENNNDHSQGFGQYVRIKGTDGLYYYYGHLAKIYVIIGQNIKDGECIGLEGTTGKSTGNHLHLEIRKKVGVIKDMKDSVNVEELLSNDWSSEAVKAMTSLGITDGTRLKDNITREEVITMLYRLYKAGKEL